MLTDNARTIPKIITKEQNINQAIVFLYWVFDGYIFAHGNPTILHPTRSRDSV